MTHEEAVRVLAQHGQSHLLAFWPQLTPAQQTQLLAQVATLNFESIDRMQAMLQSRNQPATPAVFEPAPVVVMDDAERQRMAAQGEAVLRAGKAGVILVAGGQGSRLGYEGPKGCYTIGALSKDPLFAIHAGKIAGLERKYNTAIPLYIMTSTANDAETRSFFQQHGYFGLNSSRVHFFIQGMWPALTEDGKIILDEPGRIFVSPDGHGGILAALKDTGMLADMEKRGLTTLFYFQVDNPLVEVADPAFIGLHAARQAEISVKVCAKRDAQEGLGVVTQSNGRCAVVEYTELTQAQKTETGPDGHLKFLYGSVAIHIFDFAFLKKEAGRPLPLHIAHKKVPCCDAQGKLVKPEKPNAFKFEKFVFDVLPDAMRVVNLVFDRADEFSPVKNATGADSPETVQRDMTRKFARWLEQCGVTMPRDPAGEPCHRIEISPAFAVDVAELRARLKPGMAEAGDLWLH